MCRRNKLTPAQKAVKKWKDYKTSLVMIFISFLVILGLSAAGIALNDPYLNGIFAGHLTLAVICAVLVLALLARTKNHFDVVDGMPMTRASPQGTYAIFWLSAILWIGMFVGLIALWSNDYSRLAKRRGFDVGPGEGISQASQDGVVAGCLTLDLTMGLGSFQVMYNLYASVKNSRKASEGATPSIVLLP